MDQHLGGPASDGGGRGSGRRRYERGSTSATRAGDRQHAPTYRSPRGRRLVAAAATVLLLMGAATTTQAATKVTVPNPGGLVAVGPVNSEHGFPTWYQDKDGVRVEPCYNGDDPLCGLLPGDIPNPDAPVSFPDNWPGEMFYQLVSNSLTLPGGGKVSLTLGVEATFANGDPVQGDQVTFASTRITVVGGPASTTVTFKHPFGEATIDLDASGKGKLVQDITPAVGNFTTALGSNFGPFLKWDPAVAPAAPAGYLGDPGQPHAVVGGQGGYNKFTALTADGTVLATSDQFGVSGKIATNTGIAGDYARINGGFLDVFASSTGDQLQVDGVSGQYVKTPMTNDTGSSRHYARIALLNGAKPTSVTVRNIADKPQSTAVIKLADVTVTQANYDGTNLIVAADSDNFPLTVAGVGADGKAGTLPGATPVTFPLAAPPATVSVKSANGAAVTFPVTVTGGSATDSGLPAIDPQPAGPPVTDGTTPDNPNAPAPATPVANVAAPAATLPGGSVTLDASTSTGAKSYAWTQVSGPATTITNATTAKPTVTLPYFITNAATAPVPNWAPVTFKVTATNASGSSDPKEVTIPVKTDTVVVTAARHRIGTELRIDGTSLIDGAAGVLTPPTSVTVWNTSNPAAPTKLGTAPVDTLGAWPIRLKPGPNVQVTSVLVQSTRGGSATSGVTNR